MKIVITGANGLLGRIFATFLSQQRHCIIGFDNTEEGAISTRFQLDAAHDSHLLKETFCGKYVKVDLTNKDALKKNLIAVGEVNLIIHLAALMEVAPAEEIEKVNITGTNNIFACCHELDIRKIIYASSIQTIASKLLYEEPYCSINNGVFKGDLNLVPKISVNERVIPQNASPSVNAYVASKFNGEDQARIYADKNITTLISRFGAISSTNIPYSEQALRPIWCSHDDACLFIEKAIARLLIVNEPFTRTYYVCSNNPHLWLDMTNDLEFSPKDNSEIILQNQKKSTVAEFSVFNHPLSCW